MRESRTSYERGFAEKLVSIFPGENVHVQREAAFEDYRNENTIDNDRSSPPQSLV